MAVDEQPVLIVGAGLSGLTLAQGLKKVFYFEFLPLNARN